MNEDSTQKRESALQFPCEFPIKAFGVAEKDFPNLVFKLIKKHVKGLKKNAMESKHSKKGNYLSVTITITAQSKEQLDAIYQDLTKEEKVLMAL